MAARHPVDIKAWLILFVVVGVMVLSGCRHQVHDHRLERIAAIVSENPHVAIDSLASIDRGTLSGTDRYYYDFLTVKSRDKAYVRHTSDSLYLSVLDYYTKHRDDPLYPEVLYYGGRVYSDLGDYPTALSYFQRTLDELPDKTQERDILDFKANVLSQTGRLLTNLNLLEIAIPYIELSIEIDKELNDTLNLVYDLQLLGSNYRMRDKYDSAQYIFKRTFEYKGITSDQKKISNINLSEIKRHSGELDSALYYLKNILTGISEPTRNYALAIMSRVYLEASLYDSAYHYSKELISSKNPKYKEIAYEVILDPSLKDKIPQDSLNSYLSSYRKILVGYYKDYEMQLILNRKNFYDYRLHVRKKEKAEKEKAVVWYWLLGSLSVLLLLIMYIIYYISSNRKRLINLQITIDNLKKFSIIKDRDKELNQESIYILNGEEDLREKLMNQLKELYDQQQFGETKKELFDTEVYKQLNKYVINHKTIGNSNLLWNELEKELNKAYPKFKEKLLILTHNKLKRSDLQIAILIKYDLPPKEIATLLGITKGAVVSRRDSLSLRIFGEKLGTKYIDSIIRLL